MLMKYAKKQTQFRITLKAFGKSKAALAKEQAEHEAQSNLDALRRHTHQKQSSFRGAARSGSTKEHFDELVRHLKPKKMFLRALAKADKAMPDAMKHPNLNRMARVSASAMSDFAKLVKNNPKLTASLGAGLAALSLGGLVVKKTKKHDETIM